MRDVHPGVEIGGYRLESVVGRGGMGVVYLAQDVRLGRRVALKILPPEVAEDSAFRARFIRESRLAASVDHPFIVPVFDAGEDDGLLYIAMRYVVGTDLGRVLRSEGRLEPRRTLRLIDEVGSALDAAHAVGLVHRDVKPENILVAPGVDPDDPPTYYLGDFGLTRRISSVNGLSTSEGFSGTIHYAAPEVIEGRRMIDGRADVYSLGCVVYQCLTGSVPFPRETEFAVGLAQVEDPRPTVTALRPELPPAIDQVIGTAMARRSEDRFPTAGALAHAVRAALDGTSGGRVGGRRGGAKMRWARWSRAWKLAKRRRWTATAVVLLLAIGAVQIVVWPWPWSRPSPDLLSGAQLTVITQDPSTQTWKAPRHIDTHGKEDFEPAPSPDGKLIAFVRRIGGTGDIFIASPDGSDLQDLTNSPADDSQPAWSPDGSQIAFVSDRYGSPQVYLMTLHGTDVFSVRPLVQDSNSDQHPTWSPDGRSIAFATARVTGPTTLGPSEIEIVDVATGRSRRVTNEGSNFGPAWCPSPSRNEIAFVSRRDGNREIYVMSPDQESVQGRLTFAPRSDWDPTWSSDCRRLAFVSTRTGSPDIWVMDPNDPRGPALQRLTSDRGEELYPAWSGDNSIYYAQVPKV